MTQEEKALLLKDLCGRLPYGVIMQVTLTNKYDKLVTSDIELKSGNLCYITDESGWKDYKPYLFPLSSMTEEQKKEYKSLCIKNTSECTDLYDIIFPKDYYDTIESIDYLYKNHIDVRGLIEKGLAIEATNLNIY